MHCKFFENFLNYRSIIKNISILAWSRDSYVYYWSYVHNFLCNCSEFVLYLNLVSMNCHSI